MSREREPRFDVELLLRVFGIAADGRPFSQEAHAQNISAHGAKLSGLEKRLKPGDVIGVQFGGRKARCKVIWVLDTGEAEKIEVGVERLEGQSSPWQNETVIAQAGSVPMAGIASATGEKRRFPRRRIPFPIELRDDQSAGRHMQTNTSDIAGGGCYIETRQPLPVDKLLTIIFWLNSKKVQTTGVVRTCDGAVGMGIEFTGLDEATKLQLHELVEAMALEATPFARANTTFS